jgi:hypothetical protein
MHDTRPAPGEIIGYRKDGRPIRLAAGGSETAVETPPAPPSAPAPPQQPPPAPPAAPPAPAQPQQQAPAAPAQPAAPAAPAPAAEPDWKAQAETSRQEAVTARAEADRLKAEAERWKQQSRQQEARSKANHQQVRGLEGVVRQIAEKLEIPFDDKPDPEEVARRLTEAQTVARQRTVELAVYTTAAEAGAMAAALLDSREFMARTAMLDPDAADFPSQVADLVREAAQMPKYQAPAPPPPPALTPQVTQPPSQQQPAAQFQQPPAQPPAASSGADFNGAPGGNRMWTQADYDYWTAPGRDRDGSIMSKAIADGLLVNLGVGKPSRKSRR